MLRLGLPSRVRAPWDSFMLQGGGGTRANHDFVLALFHQQEHRPGPIPKIAALARAPPGRLDRMAGDGAHHHVGMSELVAYGAAWQLLTELEEMGCH